MAGTDSEMGHLLSTDDAARQYHIQEHEAWLSPGTISTSLPAQYRPFLQRFQRISLLVQQLEGRTRTPQPRFQDLAKHIGNSTYLKKVSPLFGYFWLSWKKAHGAIMILIDLALVVYAVTLVRETQYIRYHTVATLEVADWIGVPFYVQPALSMMTWIFGYIGPRASSYIAHALAASVRVFVCAVCFLDVYFRTDFGFTRPVALKLMSVLTLASMAHLVGAGIRTTRFLRDRARALHNLADRRLHNGNGFMISYLSPEEQEKQKTVARKRVSTRESYVETADKYWHCPTPEIDLQHEVHTQTQELQGWLRLRSRRTRLQEHAKHAAYVREWPLNFTTTEILHNDLFAHCECCLDTDELPGPVYCRQEVIESMQTRRAAFLANAMDSRDQSCQPRPLPSSRDDLADELLEFSLPDSPPIPLHQLCSRCEVICSTSKLLSLLISSDVSQFWRHIKATFTFTSTGSLLEEMFLLWDTALELCASASKDCHLCSMLWSSLSPTQQAALMREAGHSPHTGHVRRSAVFVKILSPHGWQPGKVSHTDPFQYLYLVPHFGPRRVARYWMDQKMVLRSQSLGRDPILDFPELLPPVRICLTDPADLAVFTPPSSSPSTGSPKAMSSIMYWLAAHDHHPLNGQAAPLSHASLSGMDRVTQQAITRPKRLLEILPGQRVRLVCDLPEAQKAPYVALSYCWHTSQNCKLQKENLALYMGGVTIDTLPNTIQDAVYVTQTLGFDYIWIDALCIVQDWHKDKTEQMMNMRGVYAGAAFVIAAAAAMDSSQRFLVDQIPYATSACLLDTNWDDSRRSGTYLTQRNRALVAVPCQKFVDVPENELPLSRLRSRGWVYQEEELAARVIYFCDRQLLLRCNLCNRIVSQQYLPTSPGRDIPDTTSTGLSLLRSLIASTFQSLASRTKVFSTDFESSLYLLRILSGQLSSMKGHRTFTAAITHPNTHQERWWALVEEYTSRHLTFGADKLPAIQGLADRFEAEILASQNFVMHPEPVGYLSGLWSGKALCMGLLWYVKDGITLRPETRASSWTWAAIDGVVGNNSLTGDANANACGVSVLKIPDSRDQSLVLRAMVKRATWRSNSNGQQNMSYVGHYRNGTVRFHQDLSQYEPRVADLTQGPEAHVLYDDHGHDIGFLILDSTSDLCPGVLEVYCLKVVVKPSTRRDEHDFNVPWATRGLALVKDQAEQGSFRRIGYFELRRTPGGLTYPTSPNPFQQRAVRQPPPNIDVFGFFDGCELTNVVLR